MSKHYIVDCQLSLNTFRALSNKRNIQHELNREVSSKGSGSHPDLITWQWSSELTAKGEMRAFGETPKRSICRQRETASVKSDWSASLHKRVLHGFVAAVVVLGGVMGIWKWYFRGFAGDNRASYGDLKENSNNNNLGYFLPSPQESTNVIAYPNFSITTTTHPFH